MSLAIKIKKYCKRIILIQNHVKNFAKEITLNNCNTVYLQVLQLYLIFYHVMAIFF